MTSSNPTGTPPHTAPARRNSAARVIASTAAAALVMGGALTAVLRSGEPFPPADGGAAAGLTPTPAPTPSATPGAGSGRLARFTSQTVDWRPCDDSFECAKIQVPVDYKKPDGASIELAVIRHPASDPAKRIGSLFVNPGGPGASGVEYARSAEQIVSSDVLEAYDIVGFDPRGVGQSHPVDCLTDSQLTDFLAAEATPDTTAEEQAMLRAMQDFGAGCEARSKALLGAVGTPNVARDLDVLRAALGDQVLYYLGASYGTAIGAEYAAQFPHRVGRLVLDGAVDPDLPDHQLSLEQAVGFEEALQAFAEDCAADRCRLGNTPEAVVETVQQVLAEADTKPLPTGDPKRPLTESLALSGTLLPLYLPPSDGYPLLRRAMSAAVRGNGAPLLELADYLAERSSDGTFPNNANEAIYAVNCADRNEEADLSAMRSRMADYERQAPTFGRYLAWGEMACYKWPVPGVATSDPRQAVGAAPILVVGTTGDPATPYRWAESLAEELPSGVLLTRKGFGHTGYQMGSACTDRAIDRYLLTGTAPSDGTTCS